MADCFDIARTRLHRAFRHLGEFWQEADRYLALNPFGTDVEPYVEGGKSCLRFVFRVRASPPKELGIIAGDCIHNLRATLDNLVWGLGKLYPPTERFIEPEKLYFPVFRTSNAYKKALGGRTLGAIRAFPPEVQAIIDTIQPYRATRESHLLLVLHELWNANKHRVPDLMGAADRGVSVTGYNLQQPAGLTCGTSIVDGHSFGYGVIPECGISQDAKIELLGVEVCFHEDGPAARHVAKVLLLDLANLVGQLIAKIESACASAR